MKIKFIKDLDENEMADFKKSSLHKIINNNWIPTIIKLNMLIIQLSFFRNQISF